MDGLSASTLPCRLLDDCPSLIMATLITIKAAIGWRRCYNNTASLHVYSAFHRCDGNNHSGFHIDVYKHVHILVYKHIHIDVYKHVHYFM
ncbi:hypothetical protein WR25_15905 [Diploscapter pachys]|uniref:Uncharacterized protein n=1 Tax=Diploscapter pachys TaxID=2018661 RepID=A0A2A2J3F0_9BILA|nr:hypothetical protein WR25_15905 [Diploscapter pachys]